MAVSIARTYAPVEIDLWGQKFETVDVPRSGAKKATAIEKDIDQISADADGLDALVDLMAQLMDIKLKRVEGTGKPGTLIKKKWNTDELTVPQLMSFMSAVRDAEGEGNRPS
jgi:hypothetical protein